MTACNGLPKIAPRALAVLLCAIGASAARAQPARLDVAGVEATVRAVYTSQTTAERAEFHLRQGETERRAEAEVWIDPNAREFGLDLEGLRVWGSGGVVRVADAPTGGRYWEAPLEAGAGLEALSSVLPPLALPQLSSAFDREGAAGRSSLAPDLVWQIAQRAARSVRLVGRSGAVAVTAQVGDGRWRRMTFHDDDAGWSLDARFSVAPAARLERALWLIEPEGRERVPSLGDLRPAPRVAGLPEAIEFPLMTMAGPPASHGALRHSLRGDGTRPGGLGVFVLYEVAEDPAGQAVAARAIEAVGAAQARPAVARVWPVAVHAMDRFSREAVAGEVPRWDRRLRPEDRLFWAVGAEATMGDVSPGAEPTPTVLALVIDSRGRQWLAAPIENAGDLAEWRVRLDVVARAHAAGASPEP